MRITLDKIQGTVGFTQKDRFGTLAFKKPNPYALGSLLEIEGNTWTVTSSRESPYVKDFILLEIEKNG